MKLSHFNGAAHVLRTLVDEFVLEYTHFLVVVSLDVGLDLTLNNAAHLVRDWVAILHLAVDDSCRGVKGVKNGLASVLADPVPCQVKMRQGMVLFGQEFTEIFGTSIANHILSQVEMGDHLSIR